MSAAFRSIGTPDFKFNAATTPGAPAGFQVGDILVAGFWEHAGTDTPPDLSAFGFTRKTLNSGPSANAIALYTKTAQGGDTMPTAQLGADYCGSFCAAYGGATEILDRVSVERPTNGTSGFPIPGMSAPPSDGDILVMIALRNNLDASSPTISNYGSFTQRASIAANVNGINPDVVVVFEDWIQTTATAVTLGSQFTSPPDSVAQTSLSAIIVLQARPLIPPQPVLAKRRHFFVDEGLILVS